MHQLLIGAIVCVLALQSTTWTITEACSCMPEHPQNAYCRSDYVVKAVVERQEIKGSNFTTEYGTFDIDPQRIYHVRVLQTFKRGNSGLTQGKTAKITTSVSESSCGATLRRGATYLLSGHVYDGKSHIGLCSWYTEWKNVTPKQQKGLLSLYDFNCQCEIQQCWSSSCRTVSQRLSCDWPMVMLPHHDCLAQHSVCTKAGNGSCFWSRGRSRSDCERSNASRRKLLRNSEMLP